MLPNDLLLDAFDRIKQVVHTTLAGLDEDALTFQPVDNANTIAWLIWHLSRIQDGHISELRGSKQVWVSAGWADKFDLPFDDDVTGYGHDPDDVLLVNASSQNLQAYYDAVHAQTQQYIQTLQPTDYQTVVDTTFTPPVTLAVRLISIMTDDLQHAGQAAYVRGLLP